MFFKGDRCPSENIYIYIQEYDRPNTTLQGPLRLGLSAVVCYKMMPSNRFPPSSLPPFPSFRHSCQRPLLSPHVHLISEPSEKTQSERLNNPERPTTGLCQTCVAREKHVEREGFNLKPRNVLCVLPKPPMSPNMPPNVCCGFIVVLIIGFRLSGNGLL